METLQLTKPEHAYLFGFIQGDGTLYRAPTGAKGRLRVELSMRDHDLIDKFQVLFPFGRITYRERSTNFSEDYQSIVWSVGHEAFREQLRVLGVPEGEKSAVLAPPSTPHSVIDYWRGLVDADGAIGLTATGLPFVTFVTSSEFMARAFEAFIANLTGKQKRTSRNRRDQVFNICVFREDAVKLATALYTSGCLCLERKRLKAEKVKSWTRPASMRRVPVMTSWTPEQDKIVLTRKPCDAQRILGRSRSSVSCRKTRLLATRAAFVIKDNDQSAEGAA